MDQARNSGQKESSVDQPCHRLLGRCTILLPSSVFAHYLVGGRFFMTELLITAASTAAATDALLVVDIVDITIFPQHASSNSGNFVTKKDCRRRKGVT